MAGRFVVDNPGWWMAWCFADEASPYADAVLESLGKRQAVVPAMLAPLEVGNVLAVAERKQRLDKASVARFSGALAAIAHRV